MAKYLLQTILFFTLSVLSYAQPWPIHISPSKDTIKLGEPTQIAISIEYPKGKQLIFPDSNHVFGTMEFVSKTFFTTQSNDSTSKDSAVYTFTSFELESPQYLKIPIYVVTKNDSNTIDSDSVAIYIQEVIDTLPTPIVLKENTNFVALDQEINYWLIGFIGGALVLLVIVLILVFGGKIIRLIKVKRLHTIHRKFLIQFEQLATEVAQHPEKAEQLVSRWKAHLSTVSKQPYSSYSTAEIYEITKNEALKRDLRLFDQIMYSSTKLGAIDQAKNSLITFAEEVLTTRVNQLKQHGRK